jgi:hypothetical protein
LICFISLAVIFIQIPFVNDQARNIAYSFQSRQALHNNKQVRAFMEAFPA